MKKTRLIFILFLFCTVVASYFIGEKIDKSNLFDNLDQLIILEEKPETNSVFETALVTRIIDGDTIELENGKKVRFIGINTPETKHPNKDIECYGEEASAKTSELLLNKSAILEKDISETDRYGRLLRYVYIDETMINEYLVKNGYALASSYPPDVKYQEKFKQAEAYARENNLGLWRECK